MNTYVPIYCAAKVEDDRIRFLGTTEAWVGTTYAYRGRCCFCGEKVRVVT